MQKTLLDQMKYRGGKINGEIDPRLAAAKARAKEAVEKANKKNEEVIKSDLDLDVS